MKRTRLPGRPPVAQRGASLLIVLIILVVTSMLGVMGMQIAMMAERGARNDRDVQVAWQSAEAGLQDAEFDIAGPVTSTRRSVFGPTPDVTLFPAGCGTSGTSKGLCALVASGKPAWLTVDFDGNAVASFGQFTGQAFPTGSHGAAPSRPPRYVIEPVRDPGDRDLASTQPKFIYRITAMGYGPRPDVQVVLQVLFRS